MTEQEQVLELFLKSFSQFRNRPIIFYGLGRNTRYLLEHVKGFQIAGLMDRENEGQNFMGYPVLTPSQAVERSNLIIIVARDSVRKIIYERIREICAEHHTEVFSVTGEKMERTHVCIDIGSQEPYWQRSQSDLICEIEQCDVVSFDLFDTLISRSVIRPEHIFDVVENEVSLWVPDYSKQRKAAQIQAEQTLIMPTLRDIYAYIQENCGLSEWETQQLMERELEAELRFSTPRPEMQRLFHTLVKSGKQIYLLTDMYLERAQLQPILEKHHINGYKEILISCEMKADKQSGAMFDWLLAQTKSKAIVHIGDNFQADVEQARRHGLRGSYIMSSQDLMARSSLAYLLVNPKTVGDSVVLGTVVAEMLSDPFSLCNARGKWTLKNFYQLGFVCFGPVLLYFIQFLVNKLQDQKDGTLLLCARDGYCIQALYERIRKMKPEKRLPPSIYFLTSRRAVTVASLRTREDVKRIAKRISTTGKFEDILWRRFGIKAESHDCNIVWNPAVQANEFLEHILKYCDAILERASQERAGYQSYIKRLKLEASKPLWMFDFITSGTIPYYLSKLLNRDVPCFCFGTADLPNALYPGDNPIQSLFGRQSFYHSPLTIMKQYQLLESILTAPSSQLTYFDLDGTPIYEPRNHMQDIFENIQKIQKGGIDFVLRSIELFPDILSAELTEKMVDNIWELLSPEHSEVAESIKNCFLCESEYEGIQTHPIWDEVM